MTGAFVLGVYGAGVIVIVPFIIGVVVEAGVLLFLTNGVYNKLAS